MLEHCVSYAPGDETCEAFVVSKVSYAPSSDVAKRSVAHRSDGGRLSRSLDAVQQRTRNQDLSESPSKEQFKLELQQQWLWTQEMIADRDYRTEEALISQRESFKRAASQFEQEARDTVNAEVAESTRR